MGRPRPNSAHRLGIVGFLAMALLAGCAAGPDPLSPRESIPDDAPFLLEPWRGFAETLSATATDSLRGAHRALVERGAVNEALVVSGDLLRRDPELAPAIVLEAQADLVAGRAVKAVERLEPVVRRYPEYDAALLALARAAERSGSPVVALEAYGALSSRSQLADSRLRAVRPEAVKTLESEVNELLGRSRIEDAEKRLAVLERWAPDVVGTLRVSADVAAATGDSARELEALRRLAGIATLGQELELRRAHLELDVGDASAGLRVFQDLAAASPDNARLAAELARAEFIWRLGLLPEKVKQVAGLPSLTRADFAVLLYWLFPSVRYGHTDSGRIANDVLEHPYRDEIVRVANLGIMGVDPRLHRFGPESPLTRAAAIVSILRVMSTQRHPPACLSGQDVFRSLPSSMACELAVRCGIIDEPESCHPQESPAGRTALEWTRRALDQLGGA